MGDWDRRFREVNDFADVYGYAAAWPNFHQANYGDGTVSGTFFVPQALVEWRDVLRANLGNPAIDDVPAMLRAANDYAAANGFAAGMPTFHQADYGAGVVYGITLFKSGTTEFRDVPATELMVFDRRDAPRMFRAASDYAAVHGFAGAFPTFHQADYGNGLVYGLHLLAAGSIRWSDVSAELLRNYSDVSSPMLVILCFPSDVAPPAGSNQRWIDMMTPGGTDPSNVVRYFSDISHRQYDAGGTTVTAWLNLNQTTAQLNAGGQQRGKIISLGMQAAAAAGIDTGRFTQVIVACNINYDHGSGGGNRVLLAYAEGRPFEPTFFFHEVGHALGLGHSSADNLDGLAPPLGTDWGSRVYENRFDIMSAMRVFDFNDERGRLAGPGACAINLENLGWLHRSRVYSTSGFAPTTITLTALNRPSLDHPFAVRLMDPLAIGRTYYVEYREPSGWDVAFSQATILVTYRNQEQSAEILGSGRDYRGALTVGEQITLDSPLGRHVVRVESIDAATSTADVRVWRLPLNGQRAVRIVTVLFDPDGPEWQGEFVLIRNDMANAVAMGHWRLSDLAGHTYELPAGTELQPGHDLRIWTGPGLDSTTDLHMGRHAAIWNNIGDTATLRDTAGSAVSTFVY